MPTFQRDAVAYALALADPTTTPTDARLARHDDELARRYQRNGQLASVLEGRGIPPTDAATSAVMLLSEIFVARHAALPQAVDRAIAYYQTVLADAGAGSAWHTVEPPARGVRAFVPSRSPLDRMVVPAALDAAPPARSRGGSPAAPPKPKRKAGRSVPARQGGRGGRKRGSGRGRSRRPTCNDRRANNPPRPEARPSASRRAKP